ncbi:carbon-nitrogen family hydrolase [Desulforhopalus sp. 52FAK]
MHIAIIQQHVEVADKKANFANVTDLVEKALQQNPSTDLVILPELWSTGYALKELGRLASRNGEEEALFLAELANKHNVWFAGGSVAAKTMDGITNRAQIIDRQGNLCCIYDKVHLVPMLDEHKYLVAGDKSCTYTIEGITFGFAICYDIRFCQFIHKLALDGAQAIIVSAQWPLSRINHWQALLKARAIENQCYVLAANNITHDSHPFGGSSMVYGPDGNTIFELADAEAIRHTEIDTRLVQQIRQQIPIFQGRRPELY